jgi:hypothetical protein
LRAGANFELFYKRNPTGNVTGLCEGRGTPGIGDRGAATIVRGVLELPQASSHKLQAPSWLLDISGRRVAELRLGANDVSWLAPAVYFVGSAGLTRSATKVIVAR